MCLVTLFHLHIAIPSCCLKTGPYLRFGVICNILSVYSSYFSQLLLYLCSMSFGHSIISRPYWFSCFLHDFFFIIEFCLYYSPYVLIVSSVAVFYCLPPFFSSSYCPVLQLTRRLPFEAYLWIIFHPRLPFQNDESVFPVVHTFGLACRTKWCPVILPVVTDTETSLFPLSNFPCFISLGLFRNGLQTQVFLGLWFHYKESICFPVKNNGQSRILNLALRVHH